MVPDKVPLKDKFLATSLFTIFNPDHVSTEYLFLVSMAFLCNWLYLDGPKDYPQPKLYVYKK